MRRKLRIMKTSILKTVAGLYCGYTGNKDQTIKILFLCLFEGNQANSTCILSHIVQTMQPCNATFIAKLLFNQHSVVEKIPSEN